MPSYIKHLIECNCILKQFELIEPAVFHKFIVFSIINDDETFKASYAKCNNCGGIHKVMEIGKSEKLKRDTAPSLPVIDEIKTNFPEKLIEAIGRYNLDLPSWQEIKFLYENEVWGKPVILYREEENGESFGKCLMLIGKTLWKIDNFSTEDL